LQESEAQNFHKDSEIDELKKFSILQNNKLKELAAETAQLRNGGEVSSSDA
jgi:hypothetical protein